ncbi:MAG: hypothetical protein M0Z41_05955 [Peptococcaceae bacterium]|jgi:hypothetical protein|nr:hypothetical protein [Peptococcaceae bacterium]
MLELPGNCLTTAMGILPHTDLDAAMATALSVDIPFWPQLPRYSFYEDMYVQVSEHFPGIVADEAKLRLQLELDRFYAELPEYAGRADDEAFFRLSPGYSVALNAFLERDLSGYPFIRGQSIGPISFGFKIHDESLRPIIYNDDIRAFLYDFIARKANAQYHQLREANSRAFVWMDEPGLEILFGSFTGYPSSLAKEDFRSFLDQLEGPKGVHLCGNPDWSFLLSGLDLDILSVDIFGNGPIFVRYTDEIAAFLARGGIISWGIVPTLTGEFDLEDEKTLLGRLLSLWDYLHERGVDRETIARRAWLAPARCCLINADGDRTVNLAFDTLKRVARDLRGYFGLPED